MPTEGLPACYLSRKPSFEQIGGALLRVRELGIVRGLFAGMPLWHRRPGRKSGAGVLIGPLQVYLKSQKFFVLLPRRRLQLTVKRPRVCSTGK
jgi:hypothetical protein